MSESRVIIAEDHAITGWGIAFLLSGVPGVVVIDNVTDGSNLSSVVSNSSFDLLILDIGLPGQSGLEFLKTHQEREFAVIIFSGQHAASDFQQAYDLGAEGLVSKGDPPEELISAITAVTSGSRYLSPQVSGLIVVT